MEAAAELEQQAERRARKWLQSQRVQTKTVDAELVEQQKKTRVLIDEALASIEEERKLRASVADAVLGSQLLITRWPDLPGASVRPPVLPPVVDYAGPIVKVTAAMLHLTNSLRPLITGGVASDSPEDIQRKRLAALKKFIDNDSNMVQKGKRKNEIPDAVRAILLSAPNPGGRGDAETAEADRRGEYGANHRSDKARARRVSGCRARRLAVTD